MKRILPLLFLCWFVAEMSAQLVCPPANERLSVNEVNTTVNPLYLWWNGNDGQFNYPNTAETSVVFAGGLWVTGQLPAGGSVTSVTNYGAASNDFDFQSGPVGTGGNFTASTYFCRSFRASKVQISAHLADLADGTLDQPIAEIMEWPAKGNVLLPATAVDRSLAPFVDLNNDGLYQPEAGEYPDFNADEAIWWVSNDRVLHDESDSPGLGVEVQVLAQAYVAPGHPAEKAQLYTVKVINESDVNLDSLSLSLWVDPDVGCYTDDAVGSIPSRNAIYAYNLDEEDGTVGSICDAGVPTYGMSPPMVFFQALNSDLNGNVPSLRISGMSSTNPSSGGGQETRDPNRSVEYFNFAHGRWADGTQLTYGGNGYDGTVATNWIYSENPADSLAWSNCRTPVGEDRRVLLNVNLLEAFAPGDAFSSTFVVSVVTGVELPCPDISTVIPTLDSISNFVQNTVVSSSRTPRTSFKELTLMPNPARDVFSIQLGNGQAPLVSATLFDALGRVVEQYGDRSLVGPINVAQLPRGVYSLIARDTKGEMYRSRVVLQ